MTLSTHDKQGRSGESSEIEDDVYKMAQQRLKKFAEIEHHEIVSSSRSHRARTLSSIESPSLYEKLRNSLRDWQFATGSVVGVAATIAAFGILPSISFMPSKSVGLMESVGYESKFDTASTGLLTRGGANVNESDFSADSGRVVELLVDHPMLAALSDAKTLLDDDVEISGLTHDVERDLVTMVVPVKTESEVYFLEKYNVEIYREGFHFSLNRKPATVIYKKI